MQRLELKGTPREIGRQHGEALRSEIHELSQIRNHLIFNFLVKIDKIQLEELSLKHVEFLKAYPDLYEEFAGISEGSGLSISDLAVLNNYTDLRDFDAPHEQSGGDMGGCSVFAVATQGAQSFYGQTWDMHASATPHMTHLSIDQNGYKTEVLTVSGCVGLAGINQDSVGVFINNMHCFETKVGLIWPCLVRGMLQQKTSAQAADFLSQNKPSSGHNYLVCDPNEFYNIEATGKRSQITSEIKGNGVTFHTNHFVGDLKETEVLSRQSKTTHERHRALEQYLSVVDASNPREVAEQIFSEKDDIGVCVPKPQAPHGPMTCGGIFYDAKTKKGFSYKGSYDDRDRYDFSI